MVDDEQDHAQEETDRAHSDVSYAQEGVLSSHPGDGAEDHALAALEAAYRVICCTRLRGMTIIRKTHRTIVSI